MSINILMMEHCENNWYGQETILKHWLAVKLNAGNVMLDCVLNWHEVQYTLS